MSDFLETVVNAYNEAIRIKKLRSAKMIFGLIREYVTEQARLASVAARAGSGRFDYSAVVGKKTSEWKGTFEDLRRAEIVLSELAKTPRFN